MAKVYDVTIVRNAAESCTMLVEAENRDEAIVAATRRAQRDPDIVWEFDDMIWAPKYGIAVYCKEVEELQS